MKNKNTLIKSKYFIFGIIIGLSIVSLGTYAYTTQPGAIGSLFYDKDSVGTFDENRTYRLHGDAVADNTIDNTEIENDEDYLIKSVSLGDSDTKLSKGSADSLRIQTSNGFIDIGPMNSSYSHFSTGQPKFYFNKSITINDGKVSSYDEDLQLQTAGSTKIFIEKDNGNVGIGTTSPSAQLEVKGDARIRLNGSDTSDYWDINAYDDGTHLNIKRNSDTNVTLYDDGNMKIRGAVKTTCIGNCF